MLDRNKMEIVSQKKFHEQNFLVWDGFERDEKLEYVFAIRVYILRNQLILVEQLTQLRRIISSEVLTFWISCRYSTRPTSAGHILGTVYIL